jgi:hypothetical protein
MKVGSVKNLGRNEKYPLSVKQRATYIVLLMGKPNFTMQPIKNCLATIKHHLISPTTVVTKQIRILLDYLTLMGR